MPCTAKVCPSKQRQRRIDDACVERIDAVGQIDAEGLFMSGPRASSIKHCTNSAKMRIPKPLPVRELREGHDAKLPGAGEVLHVVISVTTGNDSVKALRGQEVHNVYEDSLAQVLALLQE